MTQAPRAVGKDGSLGLERPRPIDPLLHGQLMDLVEATLGTIGSDEEDLTDLGLARTLVQLHGHDLRFVKPWRQWLVWDGRRWHADADGEAERRTKAVIDSLFLAAAQEQNAGQKKRLAAHAVRSSDARHVRGILELASTELEVVVGPAELDTDPFALVVLNGTLDLRTGTLRPHSREDHLTRLAPVAYNASAPAPRWIRFLEEITGGDRDLIGFLQRAAGYTLTGDTREQCLFFAHGQGANGKTVFLETLQEVLGADYAQTTPFATFLARNGDSIRNDLARLRATRLVTASEAPGGRALDEALIKQLVGGDTIAARFLHQEFFQFRPQCKLWLRANHRPPVREQTEAFWRRMHLVPFNVTIPPAQRDKTLSETLLAERAGILAWMVEGCLAWQRDGLGEPAVVREATASYKGENDTLGEFLETRCTLEASAWTSTAELYTAFVTWWQDTQGRRERPLNRSWFGRALGERPELRDERTPRTRGWRGVRLQGLPARGAP